MRLRQITACAAVWLSCWQSVLVVAGQNAPLTVVVVEGQGAINNIRSRTSRDLVVRVEDDRQQPVAGASVFFALPAQGPSGTFANNEKSLVATTDNLGKASARGLTPNNVAGRLEIRVTASHEGKTASAAITQFNMAVNQQGTGGGNGKWIAILVAAGAAGAAGAILGTRSSSQPRSPTTPAPPPVISISPGSGSVGPPQ